MTDIHYARQLQSKYNTSIARSAFENYLNKEKERGVFNPKDVTLEWLFHRLIEELEEFKKDISISEAGDVLNFMSFILIKVKE